MARLFVLEVGPLITALLLAGRIGGSYAGEVATMQATNQVPRLKPVYLSPPPLLSPSRRPSYFFHKALALDVGK